MNQGNQNKDQTYPEKLYAGIDVSKQRLDVHTLPSGRSQSFTNNPAGWKLIIKFLKADGVGKCVMESTGKNHIQAWYGLHAAGISVCIVQPLQAKCFAKSILLLAKTDKIDAKLLASFGAATHPRVSIPAGPALIEVRDLVGRRGQLLELLTMELNHSEGLTKGAKKFVTSTIKHIQGQIGRVEAAIDNAVEKEPEFKNKRELLSGIPGVGRHTADSLTAHLPEMGHLKPKQLASLVGVAPHPKESGTYKGKRMIRGGRGYPRKALYMCVMACLRHNPVIKAFYERLKALNKPSKVAITACMNKLLGIMNAIVRDQKTWNESMHLQKVAA